MVGFLFTSSAPFTNKFLSNNYSVIAHAAGHFLSLSAKKGSKDALKGGFRIPPLRRRGIDKQKTPFAYHGLHRTAKRQFHYVINSIFTAAIPRTTRATKPSAFSERYSEVLLAPRSIAKRRSKEVLHRSPQEESRP